MWKAVTSVFEGLGTSRKGGEIFSQGTMMSLVTWGHGSHVPTHLWVRTQGPDGHTWSWRRGLPAAAETSVGGFGLSRSWEMGRGLPAVQEEGERCRGQRGGGWCLASLADLGFPTPGTPRHLDRG